MIIRSVCVIIEVFILYILQTSVFTSIALAGVVPNLLLVFVCSVGFIRGRIPATLTGLISGLMLDCTFGSVIGVYSIIYMTIGYLAGFSHALFDDDDYTFPILLTIAGSLAYYLAYFIIFYVLKGDLSPGHFFLRYVLPGTIYTTLTELVLYKLINLVNRLLYRFD